MIIGWIPSLFLLVLFSYMAARIQLRDLYTYSLATRSRWHSVRLFECAAVVRRTAQMRLNMLVVNLFALVILYELDLFMLLAEIFFIESWGVCQIILGIGYTLLIICALAFDEKEQGLFWQI